MREKNKQMKRGSREQSKCRGNGVRVLKENEFERGSMEMTNGRESGGFGDKLTVFLTPLALSFNCDGVSRDMHVYGWG